MENLSVVKSIKFLEKYKIPFAKYQVIKNQNELYKIKLKFPLAMKVESKRVVHKTEKKGVYLGINSVEEGKKAFKALKKLGKLVLVQEQIKGTEIIIGGKYDQSFGPIILIGLGGIFAELWGDFSIRLCPITKSDAEEMIGDLKGAELLKGYRKQKAVNINRLIDILLKVNKIMLSNKRILELDLNPVIANEKKALAVDARILVS